MSEEVMIPASKVRDWIAKIREVAAQKEEAAKLQASEGSYSYALRYSIIADGLYLAAQALSTSLTVATMPNDDRT